ncbi:Voltage-dependent calcium channel type A subunit alpha-1 [Symbiodinium microadriaticum]|uniref:Voltage-dependent calcium channel type A subunit alpha-1 n=1 Tax=Symbiodinium microadriaticum TaxID=2951 RepID=A0A1Q9C4G9_SYMMI|nr:Voltage-dependent calcium channel type A subunit alpha-1 [Symbiodinium microadriaticum]
MPRPDLLNPSPGDVVHVGPPSVCLDDADADADHPLPSEADRRKELAHSFKTHMQGLSMVFNELLNQHESHLQVTFTGSTPLSASRSLLNSWKHESRATVKHDAKLCASHSLGLEVLPVVEKARRPSMRMNSSFALPGEYFSTADKELNHETMQIIEKQCCHDKAQPPPELESGQSSPTKTLDPVVNTYAGGWEIEDMLGLLRVLNESTKPEKSVSAKLKKFRNQVEDNVEIDFDSFKAVLDKYNLTVNRDVKILREALKAEENHNRYLDDGNADKKRSETRWNTLQRRATLFFDVIPPLVIVVNILLIGVSVNNQQDMSEEDKQMWQAVEITFLSFYVLEAFGKMFVYSFRWYFCGPDKWWNLFDFCCILLSMADVSIFLYVQLQQVKDNPLDLQVVMLIKMLRLARLARLIRTLRFEIFYELKLMVLGVISGMRVLGWAMVLLASMIYSAAIFTTSMFGLSELVDDEMSTVANSMFTLFRCFTDGCVARDGRPLNELLAQEWGVFMYVGVTLGLFNLIMAIFIDNVMANQMQRKLQEISNTAANVEVDIKEQLLRLTLLSKTFGIPEEIEREIKALDGHFSSNVARTRAKFEALIGAKVVITKAAFLSWLTDPEFLRVLKDADIETANQSGIYEVLDADMSNSLSIEEVFVGLMRLRGPIAKSEIVGLILRLRHVTMMMNGMNPEDE